MGSRVPNFFLLFRSLLFHSFIPYPCLSSASSISHPPHFSLKGLLFFSILVSCLGSSLISIITALFPSGFICSLFFFFFALSLPTFILTLQKARCSLQTSEATSDILFLGNILLNEALNLKLKTKLVGFCLI